jgi:pimeloyl-ACP methyl ester carboxylesterase
MRKFFPVALLLFLGGCAVQRSAHLQYEHIAPGNLPLTDVALHIPGLMSCTDSPDHSVHLRSDQPVYVLVHGCFGSSGELRGLAQAFAFRGLQTVCFTYDDRARLAASARQLRRAVDELAAQTGARQITVIGHSQGALIAHEALTYASREATPWLIDFRLVTISGPFGGIAAARTCGRHRLYPLTLGLLPLSCYAVTGAKWQDITYSSAFIREPGVLVPEVTQFLKIDTNERGSCRRQSAGRCAESDLVFSLGEQRSPRVEADRRTRRLEVDAGHVEIVGDRRVQPGKLMAVLQEEGAVPSAVPDRRAALD